MDALVRFSQAIVWTDDTYYVGYIRPSVPVRVGVGRVGA